MYLLVCAGLGKYLKVKIYFCLTLIDYFSHLATPNQNQKQSNHDGHEAEIGLDDGIDERDDILPTSSIVCASCCRGVYGCSRSEKPAIHRNPKAVWQSKFPSAMRWVHLRSQYLHEQRHLHL